jgi:hypothetical protein
LKRAWLEAVYAAQPDRTAADNIPNVGRYIGWLFSSLPEQDWPI